MQPHSSTLLKKVEQTLLRHHMLSKGDRVLAGVSGGADSVALLHILLQLAPKWKIGLGIAHLNHCLRGIESDRDAGFVADLADRLNLPFHSETVNIRNDPAFQNNSLEAAARQVRYDFFDRVRRQNGYHKIALGHHRDDNAELMLMFLFRGSGLLGFSGIPPVREGGIIRPLISTGRNELVVFLNENAISYQNDQSNCDMRFLRNRIRHETIPYIQACCNPGIVDTLNRYSSIVRSEDEWLNEITQSIFEKALVSNDPHRPALAISVLMGYPEAAQRRVLRIAIFRIKGDLQRITFSHIETVRELAERRQHLAQLMLPDGIRVQINKNDLIFFQMNPTPRPNRAKIRPRPLTFLYTVSGLPERVAISEIGVVLTFSEIPLCSGMMDNLSKEAALLNMEMLNFPLTLRNIQPGDRFNPLGVVGTQKIQKYFIDHKIDRTERLQCPVLVSGKDIVWLAGHRISGHFRVMASTRRVLKVEMCRSLNSELA